MPALRFGVALVIAVSGVGCDVNTKHTSRCVDVSSQVLDFIAQRRDGVGSATLSNGKAVPSADFEDAYFVAAKLEGPRVGTGQVGLWVMDDLDDPSWISSVNHAANHYTDWGDARFGNPQFSASDNGATEALTCAKG